MQELVVLLTSMSLCAKVFFIVFSVFFLVLSFFDTVRPAKVEDSTCFFIKQIFCLILAPVAFYWLLLVFREPDTVGVITLFVALSIVVSWVGSFFALMHVDNAIDSENAVVSFFTQFWFIVLLSALTKSFWIGNIFSILIIILLIIRIVFVLKTELNKFHFHFRAYASGIVVAIVLGALNIELIPGIIAIFSMTAIFHLQVENF